MTDRSHDDTTTSTPSKPRAERRPRIARGTAQEIAVDEVVHSASGDDALDAAIQRGIAMLQAEQLEHAFFVQQLAKKK